MFKKHIKSMHGSHVRFRVSIIPDRSFCNGNGMIRKKVTETGNFQKHLLETRYFQEHVLENEYFSESISKTEKIS